MGLPFKFELAHTIILVDEYGRQSKYFIREIQSDGWMFEPHDRRGDRLYFSGETVRRHYLLGRMEYLPFDEDVIPEARKRRLREEFAAQPYARRLKALRKLMIIRRCENAMKSGMGKCAALETIPELVVKEKGDEWHREDVYRAKRLFDDRKERNLLKPGERFQEPPRFRHPPSRTIWGWIKRYVHSGRSINSLLDNDEDKGRRESQLNPDQDRELEIFLKDHVKPGAGFDRTTAYAVFAKILKGKKIKSVGRKTFYRRLDKAYDRLAIARVTRGRRATRREGQVSEPGPIPLWHLHQVEGDHALLNINVADPETGINLGRPWVSVNRDRLTANPTGLHVSLLSPSWATLSRAIAHSMWPKDLSRAPSLKNTWPCEGVFDEMYTDRGMDFISDAGREAAAELKFEILSLPGYSAWLKGGLERWNRDLKAEIMTYRDGITSFENPEYRGRNNPTITLQELRESLLEWIVDDYLVDDHSGLHNDCPPVEVWRDAVDRYGPPRPVEDLGKFRRMMMIPATRAIQNRGVEVDGYFFRDNEGRLREIKQRNGPGQYQVLIDPWDMGYIEILAAKEWIVLWNTDADLTGVSRYRSELYWDDAKFRNPGKQLTIDDFLRSREIVDADADRVVAIGKRVNRHGSQNLLGRFRDLGEFITPIPAHAIGLRRPPVEIPGWVDDRGILRPVGRSEVAGRDVGLSNRAGEKADHSGPGAGEQSSEDLFKKLAAAGQARARAIGAQ